MTNSNSCPNASDSSPAAGELIAALPYLVGFPPRDSLVVVFLDESDGLVLTARLDWDCLSDDSANVADSIVHLAGRNGAAEVALIAVGPTSSPGSQESLLAKLVVNLERQDPAGDQTGSDQTGVNRSGGVAVRWAVHTQSKRWWTSGCSRSCGPRSHEVPDEETSELVARLLEEGRVQRAGRDEILAEFEPATEMARGEVARHIQEIAEFDSQFESRDQRSLSIAERVELLLFADTVLSPIDLATIAVGCGDVLTRDRLLWQLAQMGRQDPQIWPRIWPRAMIALAFAPPSHVADVGAVAGLIAWQKGDGVRASCSLERAKEHDPGHNLANLVRNAVSCGLPPRAWQEAVSSLTHAQITGVGGLATDQSVARAGPE